jgi:hypothetical protein
MRRRTFLDITIPPPGAAIPTGMTYHELPAQDEILRFWGKFLDSEDTDTGDSLRWAELQVFKIIDTNPSHDHSLPASDENRDMFGQQLWLLYTIGHSVVYHDLHASCRGGKAVPAKDFPLRAENSADTIPCPDCAPADWESAPDKEIFRLELPWYTAVPCQTPEKLINALYRKPRCLNCGDSAHGNSRCGRCGCTDYREAPRRLSVPGRNLLDKLAKVDPDIAAATVRVRTL